jgi:hypothetical protein
MEARAAALVESHFTFEGVLARIREFIADPASADLVCVRPPKTIL